MLIVFVVLTEFNSTTDIIAWRPKHVKPRNEWKTKNAGNVNTMQTPNSAEGAEWKLPSRRGVTKTIYQKHLEKEKISTTDISIKDTKDEQENLNYSAVTQMDSAYSTNSYLTKNNSTGFFHHRDNSEHIWTIVGVATVVVGSVLLVAIVFLRYYKRLLCFKRKAKCDLERSYISMSIKNINTPNEHVDEDNVLKVEVEKMYTSDTDTTEDEVDISVANTNSPVFVYEYTSKYNNVQPTDARE
jgi:hypothetical protein